MDNNQPVWRAQVLEAVNSARANNIEAACIPAWGIESAESLLAHFQSPYSAGKEIDQELQAAIENALASIDTEVDTTKGTGTYCGLLRGARSALQQNRMPWSGWVKLSKEKPTKKSLEFAEPIQMIAADYEKHPRLHQDITEFCTEIFQLAADSLAAFQNLKAVRGMIDFVDQEQRLYNLLDNPIVKTALQGELQVLMVDEFQDTSPIQLALFMRLAELADKVIWVGDGSYNELAGAQNVGMKPLWASWFLDRWPIAPTPLRMVKLASWLSWVSMPSSVFSS